MKILLNTFVLAYALSAIAQSSFIEIRATGERTMSSADTVDSAKQAALLDAMLKAVEQVSVHLKGVPEVQALRLRPLQLDALVAAIVEPTEESSRTAAVANTVVHHADVLVRLDVLDLARRLGRLRKDQEATNALVETWKETQELHQQLVRMSSPAEGQLVITKLRVKHLAAQVSAALAKTEESLGSTRIPSVEGRTRAKQLADAALVMAPDLPDAHYAMGDVLADAGQPEAAGAEYRKALSVNANSSSGHTRLANALRLEGKLPEAVAELREALRIDSNSPAAHTDLGIILAAQKNNSEAVSEYNEAIRLDPDFIDAHNNLAIALARQRQIPDAVVQFREIVRIDPDSALGYYNLGIALADMDMDEESAAAFREVIRINPNHYNARYDLAELFRLEGKFDESVKQFREYIRLAPDTPQNQRNIQRAKEFIQTYENR
jgi:tetratricopeptide (TPR) repeat protein